MLIFNTLLNLSNFPQETSYHAGHTFYEACVEYGCEGSSDLHASFIGRAWKSACNYWVAVRELEFSYYN